ncbi:hypothetical protein [Bosea vaviloviae]|uniref:Uncharacterized protein n=1 Tax=Bosea vaviloviae TaxID=1526658 RepID=A0A1D7U044_9HYPH|nr:hypothetical protein [Bosea vaviloviae]AOO80741.1 hypothetical protein BHK69_09925 [Bosea vaviloviae]
MKLDISKSELDARIAILRRDISELTAQATRASGAAAEERLAARIEEQQSRLDDLLKQREAMEEKTG